MVQSRSTPSTGLDSWRLTWVGLDTLEVAGLLVTGIALRRRHWSATVSALVSVPLFVLDAWFDVMTTTTGLELRQAVAMALLVELPTAAVLAWVARSGIRTLRAAAHEGRQAPPGASGTRGGRADATAQKPGAVRAHGANRSSCAATDSSSASPPSGATSWTASGVPVRGCTPAGTDMAG